MAARTVTIILRVINVTVKMASPDCGTYSVTDQVARGISAGMSPPVVWTLAVVSLCGHERGWGAAAVGEAVAVLGFSVIPPYIAFHKRYLSAEGAAPRESTIASRRDPIMLLAFLCGLLNAFVITTARGLSSGILVFSCAALSMLVALHAVALMGIAASGHVTGVAAFLVSMCVLWHPAWSIPGALLILMVGWARVRTRAHTVVEVITGCAIGLAIPLIGSLILAMSS